MTSGVGYQQICMDLWQAVVISLQYLSSHPGSASASQGCLLLSLLCNLLLWDVGPCRIQRANGKLSGVTSRPRGLGNDEVRSE